MTEGSMASYPSNVTPPGSGRRRLGRRCQRQWRRGREVDHRATEVIGSQDWRRQGCDADTDLARQTRVGEEES